jgi:3-mercaptopyruvate sulfurtransferase SseA
VALMLKREGVTRVRPLAGGLAGWRERGFPVEPITLKSAPAADPAPAPPAPAAQPNPSVET